MGETNMRINPSRASFHQGNKHSTAKNEKVLVDEVVEIILVVISLHSTPPITTNSND